MKQDCTKCDSWGTTNTTDLDGHYVDCSCGKAEFRRLEQCLKDAKAALERAALFLGQYEKRVGL